MSEGTAPENPKRRPAAFHLPDDTPPREAAPPRAETRRPGRFDAGVSMIEDKDDPFLSDIAALEADALAAPASRRRRGLSLAGVAASAFGILVSLALGLWTDRLIRDLFTRADWLGYTALAAAATGLAALLAILMRELLGLRRLAAVQSLKEEAEAAMRDRSPKRARAVTARLVALTAGRPETALARERLNATEEDIIDSRQMIELAERELLEPLDRRARQLILGAARRVSIVTAVSPRAIVDLSYVLYEAARLVRAMAELYGGRPGTFGMLRLMRDVLAHLAVTGSIAVGDGIIQQVIGHGLASKLSARLGEGVVNGLMTARIGIAAMDYCRPLPFRAVRRPGIGDFAGDLRRTDNRSE